MKMTRALSKIVYVLSTLFFQDRSFENRNCAKIERNYIEKEFLQNLNNLLRANFVQKTNLLRFKFQIDPCKNRVK